MTDKIEALGNAEEIAKLTGRSKAEVIEDLLDDGKLNNSNAIKENTSAIDRATEMANKTHKLLTALIPILLLISTSGLELTGIIDLTPAGNGDDDEWFWEDEEYEPYWGCTDYDADNYDEYATDDDGSCEYEPEEQCEPLFYDYYLDRIANTSLEFTYDVDVNCNEEQEVEVQFLAYDTNGTYEMPYNYSIDIWNVYNGDAEYRNMTLGSFTNGTYDIYVYLLNQNDEMIDEIIWYNIELKARTEDE